MRRGPASRATGSPWKKDSVGDAGGDRGGGDGGAGGEDGGRRRLRGAEGPRPAASDTRGGCCVVGHFGAAGDRAVTAGSGAGFDGATMGRVARHVPGGVAFAGDFLTETAAAAAAW